MAWQQSDLDKLDACIASGVLVTRFADGREVRYQTLEMLLAARRVVAAQLSTAEAVATGAVRRRFASYTSGL
jgi:hypothetical protein